MEFVTRAHERQLVVGVLGLGYVGIPLALSLCKAGFQVIGFDVLDARITQMNSGVSPIRHISGDDIQQMRALGFEATTAFSRAPDFDSLIVCVPTPLDSYREPDLSFVMATMDSIALHLR